MMEQLNEHHQQMRFSGMLGSSIMFLILDGLHVIQPGDRDILIE